MIAPYRRYCSRLHLRLPVTLVLSAAAASSAVAAPVLISIDGMKPEYVTQAD